MESRDVKARIEEGISGAQAMVNEFSGGSDHYSVTVVAQAFTGQTLIKRHRMVMDLFAAEIATGEVHALTIKALTPEQFNETTGK